MILISIDKLIEYVLLSAVGLGFYVSYEDLKYGVIRNKHILMIFLLGMFFQLISEVLYTNFLQMITTFGYGFFIGFLFWWLGLWPAGDAKFFTVLLLFLPVGLYSSFNLIFNYLVNIFVPIFLFMMIVLFIKSKSKLIKEAVKYSFEPYKLFTLITMFLGFVWFTIKFMTFIGITGDFFITILVLFIVYELFYAVLTFESELFFVGCAVLRIILDYNNIFTFNFIYNFFSTIFVFVFFRFFVLYLGYHTYTKYVKISDLRPGMSLAEGIVSKNKEYQKISFLTSSFIEFLMQRKYKFVHNLDNLTKEDVALLNKLKKEKKLPFDSVLVSQRQHFAFFILLGFLLTLILKQNFISFIVFKLGILK